MVMHFLHAGRKRDTLRGTEEPMTTIDFIPAFFCQVDEQMGALPKPPKAHLWPSEVVTLGLLHALKGGGNRAFYRWLTRDYRPLFPQLPERTRLFRLFKTHQDWTQVFLAAPTVRGVMDTSGIELIHPMREGRSPQQIGRKGLSNHRWIVGGKLCLLVNQYGLVVGWDWRAWRCWGSWTNSGRMVDIIHLPRNPGGASHARQTPARHVPR